MLIPFGVLSAAAFAPFDSDYELIASEILGSSQASVTFSSLGDYSSTYKHLQIRVVAKTDRASEATDSLRLIVNGNTTNTSYASHILLGTGSNVFSDAATGDVAGTRTVGQLAATEAPAGVYYPTVIDILDPFSTTKNKTTRSLTGTDAPDFGGSRARMIELRSNLFLSTSSVTSLELNKRFGSNFVAGSRFSLYGIKG